MKVIFLDIDGVLNSVESETWEYKWRGEIAYLYSMCPDLVENLNHILKATDAQIVLSSTWRKKYDTLEGLQGLLDKHGIQGTCAGRTGVLWTKRGFEIKQWIDMFSVKRNVESYVILDDDLDMYPVFHRHMWIDNEVGLTCVDVERAIKMLNE